MPSDKFESFKITDEALKGIGWATEGLQPQGPTREEYSQLNLKLNSSGTNDGKLFFVNNPQNTFAVYPPLNGCGGGLFTAAESAKGRCLITTNGGYFETRGKQGCHGTIISDGETVNFREETNVSFGVTEEGHIVIGYLTEEEKKEQKFKQLINGVVWIVRNGTNYVTESIRQEDMSIQETSSCPTADDCAFRSVKAGRVLLGHDKTGRIMIMAINGFKGNAGGVSLDEAAALMIDAGAVNAINMDGGGSATVFSGDTLISSPSDDCGIRGFDVPIQHSCVRNVTSVLCIKPNYPVLPPSSSNDVLLVTGVAMINGVVIFAASATINSDVLPYPEEHIRGRWGGIQSASGISHEAYAITEEANHGIAHRSHEGRNTQDERPEFSKANLKIDDFGTLLNGKLYFVNNPTKTFSVMPPLNGCGEGLFSPKETSNGSCILATNAGFFTYHDNGKHKCHGTIISNGKVVHQSDELNASFGITRNGTIIVGYLTEAEKRQHSFTQLVNGVVWIVRNGKNYINEAIKTEDMTTQESGECSSPTSCNFRSVKAGRLLLGHDKDGRIMIMGLNGFRNNAEGPDLDEAAEWMIKAGAINAINLDGGGSMSIFEDNVLVSSPSDDCDNVGANSEKLGFDINLPTSCVRPVTSILCVSSLEEQPIHFQNCTDTSTDDVSLVMITLLVEFLIIFVVAMLVYSRRTWPHVWEHLFSMRQQPQGAASIPAYSRRSALGVKKLRKKKSSKMHTRLDVDVDSWNIPGPIDEGSEMGSDDSF